MEVHLTTGAVLCPFIVLYGERGTSTDYKLICNLVVRIDCIVARPRIRFSLFVPSILIWNAPAFSGFVVRRSPCWVMIPNLKAYLRYSLVNECKASVGQAAEIRAVLASSGGFDQKSRFTPFRSQM